MAEAKTAKKHHRLRVTKKGGDGQRHTVAHTHGSLSDAMAVCAKEDPGDLPQVEVGTEEFDPFGMESSTIWRPFNPGP